MNTHAVWIVLVMAVVVVAEPPTGYNYHPSAAPAPAPAALNGGGGYIMVPVGGQTSEGLTVDSALLEEVRKIVLQEEQAAAAAAAPAPAPANARPQYGPPPPVHIPSKVVGVDLEGIKQALQVKQYHKQSSEEFAGYA